MKTLLVLTLFIISLGCNNQKNDYKAQLITPTIYHIDRIEGNIAILLSDNMKEKKINILNLKQEVKEGDEVKFYKNKTIIKTDEKLKENIIRLQKELTEVKITQNMDI